MRVPILILAMTLALAGSAIGLGTPVWAAGDAAPSPEASAEPGIASPDDEGAEEGAGVAYCSALARQCGLDCQANTEPGSTAAATCQASCAVKRAACETRDTLSRVEPWLQDRSDNMNSFLEGLESDPEDGGIMGPPTQEVCGAAHDRCVNRCDDRFGADEFARVGCESACAVDRASCETAAGLETARPLVEREMERLQGLLDSLLGDKEPPPPADPHDPDGDGILDL